jgi:single-strand DNA-binding protein
MLNKIMIIGRLGRDPELRYAASGTPMANLRIATDESYTDRDGNKVDRTEWHTVVVFQRQAENCANYLAKGSLVFVEGSLQTRKWQDQQGQDRYTTEIKASRVQFLDRKGAGQEEYGGASMDHGHSGGAGGGKAPSPQRQQPRNSQMDDLGPAFPSEASGMDDVPF